MKKYEMLCFLFDYTLRTHFSNNKSYFAKGLSLSNSDIYRIQKLLINGGSSGIAAEHLLTFYKKESLSVDEAMRGYEISGYILPNVRDQKLITITDIGKSMNNMDCGEYVREFRQGMDLEHRISTLAYALMKIVEQHFCRRRIGMANHCEHCVNISGHAICPFTLINQFVNQLKQQHMRREVGV